MQHFYNTVRLGGEELHERIKAACSQESAIFMIFKANPIRFMMPAEVAQFFPRVPITSIRRAITNLAQQGRLIKTDVMRAGPYGVQTHTWRLNLWQADLFPNSCAPAGRETDRGAASGKQ